MLKIIISVIFITVLMTLIMFLMLKKVVKILNDRLKTHFLTKLDEYNELIEKKSKELKEINDNIVKLKEEKEEDETIQVRANDFCYDELATPSYKDEKIFEKYKKINEKFDIEPEKVIIKFINEKVGNINYKRYLSLLSLEKKLTFDYTYSLIILDTKEQINELMIILTNEEKQILNSYVSEEFNILDFKNYIVDMLQEEDPTIYVMVGKEEENYNYINQLVKTVYDEKICKGFIIVYKKILYDYSLS